MEAHLVEAVVDTVEEEGFAALEIGLAAIGLITIGVGAYNLVRTMREKANPIKTFSDDIISGMEDIENDPKFKKVRETLTKKVVTDKLEEEVG